MKKLIGMSFGLLLSTTAPAACLYTLSPTIDGLDPVLLGDTAFPVVSGQTVEYTVQDSVKKLFVATSPTAKTALATALANHVPGGDITLPASGIMAVQFQVNNFITAPTSGNVVLTFGFTTGNAAPNGQATEGFEFGLWMASINPTVSRYSLVAITNTAGTPDYQVSNTSRTLAQLGAATVGLYINADRRFGYTLDGVDQGYVNDFAGNPMYIPATVTKVALAVGGTIVNVPVGSAAVGQPVGGSIVTDAAQLTEPFPAGAHDICGNPVGAGSVVTLPNGRVFKGKPPITPPGLQ